jgi:hypothetical protein
MANIPPSLTQYTDPSLNVIHHSLRAARRRLVIGLLVHRYISSPETPRRDYIEYEHEVDPIPVRQLAREIVSIEEDIAVANATGEPYHNVYTSLIQTHLPKLDDIDAINYHSNRKTVSPGENLLALALVSGITSPAAHLLYTYSTTTDSNAQSSLQNSTGN